MWFAGFKTSAHSSAQFRWVSAILITKFNENRVCGLPQARLSVLMADLRPAERRNTLETRNWKTDESER